MKPLLFAIFLPPFCYVKICAFLVLMAQCYQDRAIPDISIEAKNLGLNVHVWRFFAALRPE